MTQRAILVYALLCLVVLSGGSFVDAQQGPLGFWVEPGRDRAGADYWNGQVADRLACRHLCEDDAQCKAYAFETGTHRCWKKNAVPPSFPNPAIVSGVKDGDISLTVFFANVTNAATFLNADWRTRASRMAIAVKQTGQTPDVIALTEAAGWRRTWDFWNNIGDYETIRAIHEAFASQLGVDYRIAYVTGQVAAITGTGEYFQAEVLLYNPNRLRNLTAEEARFTSPAVHDSETGGSHLRRSLPNCGTLDTRSYIDPRMDGPWNNEKCGFGSPTAAAWNFLYTPTGSHYRRIGAYNRLVFLHEPHRPIEVYNVHLAQRVRPRDPGPLITDQTISWIPSLMNSVGTQVWQERFYVPLFLNDINVSHGDEIYDLLLQTMPGWEVVSWGPDDTMGLMRGTDAAFPSTYRSRVTRSAWLPQGVTNCDLAGTYPNQLAVFSDHCAMIFRVEPVDPDPARMFIPNWPYWRIESSIIPPWKP